MIRSMVLGLIGTAILTAAPAAAEAKPRLTGEAKLAKMLEGRVAGEGRNCINLPSISQTDVVEKTAIVYRSGSTLWVNRPASGANSLDGHSIMVTKPTGSQLCSIDTVQLVDGSSRTWRGFVQLGDFIPYRKAD